MLCLGAVRKLLAGSYFNLLNVRRNDYFKDERCSIQTSFVGYSYRFSTRKILVYNEIVCRLDPLCAEMASHYVNDP